MQIEFRSDPDVIGFLDAIRTDKERTGKYGRLAIMALSSFAACCTVVVLLASGFPLHAYWKALGPMFLLFSFATMMFALYEVLLWWGAWNIARKTRKEAVELLEDRYNIKRDVAYHYYMNSRIS